MTNKKYGSHSLLIGLNVEIIPLFPKGNSNNLVRLREKILKNGDLIIKLQDD